MGNNLFTGVRDEIGMAFNVINVSPGSPADRAGLIAGNDFILSANGIHLSKCSHDQLLYLFSINEDTPMTLKVFDVRSRFIREVVLVPSRAWNGYGVLGLSLRLESLVNDRHDPDFAYDEIYQEDATNSVFGAESFFGHRNVNNSNHLNNLNNSGQNNRFNSANNQFYAQNY